MVDFRDLHLSQAVLDSIVEMGFEEPTPVQVRAVPRLMEGGDVVAQALTGTGKTAAFGIPLVERIEIDRAQPQAVVLAPTRELTVQVAEQLSRLGRHRGLLLVPIYGGQPYERQLRALRQGVHAIVATPGRLLDHMRRGTADLSGVTMLVLDEADQMLDMGFLEDVEYVMSHLPAERVTALFPATMPEPILKLARRYMRDPEMIRLSKPQALTVPEVDQVFFQVPFRHKMDALCRVLDARRPERAIVFCATKRMVDEVIDGLQARGYLAEGLHGDMTQPIREKVLRAFRRWALGSVSRGRGGAGRRARRDQRGGRGAGPGGRWTSEISNSARFSARQSGRHPRGAANKGRALGRSVPSPQGFYVRPPPRGASPPLAGTPVC